MKKSVLTTLFALALSHAASVSAQTQPAEMGVTPTTLPEVLQVLDNTKTWVPIGSFPPGGPFIPATNGSIIPNDCLKWGPGITDAGVVCGGGGGSGGPMTIYTTHAGLVASASTPTGPYTLYQQGFTAAGKYGAATYEWESTSYCLGGTSGSPKTADNVICVLPAGQSPSTAGRFILQYGPRLDVRQYGLQAGGVFDNAPSAASMLAQLVNGGPVSFPAQLPTPTTYYFSSSLNVLSTGLTIDCGGTGFRAQPVQLLFAAGVDGVTDAGISNISGCAINSQGRFTKSGVATVGDTSITGVGPVVAGSPGFVAGDGVIVKGSYPTDAPLAVAPGETVASVVGSTVNLTTPITATGTFWTILYRLPLALADSVTTTIGSHTVTVTGGTTLFHSGDIVWSDAFPFGSAVQIVSGALGAQTLTMTNMYETAFQTATVTHAGGSGKMWRVPAGLRRWGQGKSTNAYVVNFPIGLSQMCYSGGGLNCTGTLDVGFGAEGALIGRLTAGNNSGGSQDIAGFYANNLRADVMELGTVGTYYAGTLLESGESNTGNNSSIIKNCSNPNYSMFWGVYNIQSSGVCADPTDPYSNASGPGGVFFGGTGLDVVGAVNVTTQGSGLFFSGGEAIFTGNAAPSSNCALLGGPTGFTQYMLTVTYNCGIGQGMSYSWDATNSEYALSQFVYFNWMLFPFSTGSPIFPQGLQLNGTGGNNSTNLLTEGAASPTATTRIRGNIQVNSATSPGGTAMWDEALSFSTTLTTQAVLTGQTGSFTASIASSTMAVTAVASGTICVGGAIGGAGVTPMSITALPSGNTWGCSNALGNYTLSGSQTLASQAVTATGQTAFSVAACPNPALSAAQVNVNDTTPNPDVSLGKMASCTAGSPAVVVLAAASAYASSGSSDALQFVQNFPAGLIANDTGGARWTLGNYMSLTPVALASLPATCVAGTFGVINNGVASPTYNAAVGVTTGAATDPVFCTNGNAWTYH